MKKAVIIGITATLLLTGCQNELIENSPENAIEFNAFLNNLTRSDSQKDISEIAVYGITRDPDGNETLLFDKRKITKDGTIWAYSPTEFWQKNNAYRFTAIYPFEGNWLLEDYNDNVGKTRGNLYFDNEKAKGREDLILSLENRNPVKEASIEPEIGFNLSHQLSRIYFRFENGYPQNAAYSLKISDISLQNVVSDAVMDLASESSTWTPGTARTEFTLPINEEALLHPGSGEIVSSDPVFVIPNDRPMTIEFTVELYINNGDKKICGYHHRIELPPIKMKKGFSYNLKAVFDEYNTDPDAYHSPLKFIINEIERWDESPQPGSGQI